MVSKKTNVGEPVKDFSVSRRVMMGTAAFAVPAVLLSATTPAFADSSSRRVLIETTPVAPAAPSAHGASTAAVSIDWAVRVTVTDASGRLLSGQGVSLTGTDGLSFRESGGSTETDGTFVTFASMTQGLAEDVSLVATCSDNTGAMSASTVLAAPAASASIALSKSLVTIGGSVTATVSVRNALGGRVVNAPVSLSGPGFSFARAAGATDGTGNYSTTVLSQDGSGGAITARTDGIDNPITASATLTVLDRRLNVSFSPSTVAPGANVQATVSLTDGAGEPLSNEKIVLSSPAGVVLPRTPSYITDRSGQVVVTLGTTTGVDKATLTATASMNRSSAALFSADGVLTFAASGIGLKLNLSSNAATWVRDGRSSSVTAIATVTEDGKPAAHRTVYFFFTPSEREWGRPISEWPTSSSTNAQAVTAVTNSHGVASAKDTVTLAEGDSGMLTHVRYSASLSATPATTPGTYVDLPVRD